MKKSVYVIMKKATSPVICLHEAKTHEAHLDGKKAEIACRLLEEKATTNEYWVERVPLKSW